MHSLLSSSPSSHPPALGSWQLWVVPKMLPWEFHKKCQLLRTSEISQTYFLSGALSAKKILHYLSIAVFLTSLMTQNGTMFSQIRIIIIFLIFMAIPSPTYVHPKEKTLHQILVLRPIRQAVCFFKGQRNRKNFQLFLGGNLKSGDVWNPRQCVEIHLLPARPALHLVFLLPHRLPSSSSRWEHHRRVGMAWVVTLPVLHPTLRLEGLK